MMKKRVQTQTLPHTSGVTLGPPLPFLSLVSSMSQVSSHLHRGQQGFSELGHTQPAQRQSPPFLSGRSGPREEGEAHGPAAS